MGEHEGLVAVSAAASSSTASGGSSTDTCAPHAPAHGRVTGPTRRSTKGGWTDEEDANLILAVQRYRGRNWKKIAESFPGRTDVQCLHRWQKVLNPELVKGPWTKEEDAMILKLVEKHGPKKWSLIAKSLPGRIGKQCRERWHNHLNPAIKKDAWTEAEEFLLIRAHQIYGNKWAEIARFLPGRADNSIKNHWNCSVKKKLGSYEASGLLSPLPALSTQELFHSVKEKQNVEAEMEKNRGTISLNAKEGHKGSARTILEPLMAKKRDQVEQLFDVRLEEAASLDRIPNISSTINDKKPTDNVNGAKASGASAPSLAFTAKLLQPERSLHEQSGRSSVSEQPRLENSTPDISISPSLLNDESPLAESSERKKSDEPVSSPLCKGSSHNPESLEQTALIGEKAVVTEEKDKYGGRMTSLCSQAPIFECDGDNDPNDAYGTPSPSDEPSGLKKLNNPNVSGGSSENQIQQSCSPNYDTPVSKNPGNLFDGGSSPASFLRNAARTFRNTPSILQKRRRIDSSQSNLGYSVHHDACMPEVKKRSYSCKTVPLPAKKINSGQGHSKSLFVSPPELLKSETDAVAKTVEKCLESMFDMEWDKSSVTCVSSFTADS